ncbi:MAG: hypothetical protein QOC73_863 [Actinomycetota bacterium]|nr:hypothetical protein [Actinomycetota bacterium]
MMTIGVLAFVVALLVSVMLHEGGHFLTAKLFKMKATQFFVGFGPTLWSRQKGETEYGIKAIPAGGFVKIIGMTPLEDVEPADLPRAFINKPGWQRFIVLVAGSTVHFVIAIVLLFVIALAWPSKQTGYATIGTVYTCAIPDTNGACPAGAAAAPADGVLQKGDVVLAVDGHDVRTTPAVLYGPGNPPQGTPVKGGADGLVALVRAAPAGPVTLEVERDGALKTVTMTPVIGSEHQPRLGIAPQEQFVRVGPVAAAGTAASQFGKIFTGSFGALGKIPHEIGNIFKSKTPARTINDQGASVTSVVGVARIAGEGFSSGGVSGGSAFVLSLIAAVNIFVGIFNLFPFLPLDGGHVAILGYEKLRNAWRRRRHLSIAGPVDLAKLMPLTYGVLAIIVAVSALILFADISNPVANPFQ